MVGKQEQWQKPEKFWSLLCQQHIRRKHAPGPENLTGYNMPQGSALFTNVFCYNFFVNSFINQQDFISLLHLSLNEFTLLSLSPSLPTHLAPSLLLYHVPSTIPSTVFSHWVYMVIGSQVASLCGLHFGPAILWPFISPSSLPHLTHWNSAAPSIPYSFRLYSTFPSLSMKTP